MTKKKPAIKRPLYKRILRIFMILIVTIVILLLAIALLIQTSPVQNLIRGKVVSYLQSKLHTKAEIGKIYIGFPKNIVLQDVYFEDQQHDTLFSGEKLSVNISMLKLLHSEIEINDVKLQHATIKLKRLLPDTVFNFQYIINAFSSAHKNTDSKADTSSSKISVGEIELDNIHAIYNDVVSGNDIDIFSKHLDVRISQMDFNKPGFEIPEINISGLHGKIYQNEPLTKMVADSKPNSALPELKFKNINLADIQLDYKDNPDSLFALFAVGKLSVAANIFDMDKKIISLDKLELTNTNANIRLGKTVAKKNLSDSSGQSPNSANWQIAIRELRLDENNIAFDNDNSLRQKYGMDYAHLKVNNLVFQMNDFSYSADSVSGNIIKGSLTEQSGFRLQALQGNFLYAQSSAYIKNLRLLTPGTFIQRSLVFHYLSIDALKKNISSLVLDVDLQNSKLQVKDILTFVPSLVTNPILKNQDAILFMNAKINGSIRDLKIDQLQCSGLQNTKVDMSGNIQDITNTRSITANLAIKKISSTRNDLLLFMPQKYIPSDISIPETFELSGNLKGAMWDMVANLVLNTSSGNMSVKGNFKNIDDVKNIGYNATVATDNLNLGYILKNDSTYGNITAQLKATGKGIDPKSANCEIEGSIISATYKKYNYQHIDVTASIADQHAKADMDIHDPNVSIALNGTADFSNQYPAIKISSVIDSIKTKPLHFTTDDIAYHGTLHADFPVSDPDKLKGELLIENSLIVRNGQKVNFDTIKISAGQTDSGQYLGLNTEVINARLQGHYKMTEIGSVFKQLFEPYFESSSKTTATKTDPYDFSFSLSIINRPLLKTFLPTLERLDPIHFHGHFTSSNGWNADFNSPLIIYGDNRIQNLQLHAKPQSNSLVVETTLQQFANGKNLAVFNTSMNASIANNKVDYTLNIQDKATKNKYHIEGLVQKKGADGYQFSINAENLLLNYQKWKIEKDNEIDYLPSQITANNFNLKKGSEELKINNVSKEVGSSIEISFNQFLISTITAFAGTDSLLADGEINGKIILKNATAKPTFTSDLTIQNLSIHKDTIGNIALKINNTEENKFSADVSIKGHGNDVALNGNYFAEPSNNSHFDLNLDIKRIELATMIGVSAGTIKNASGSVNGTLSINGTLDKPNINGHLAFDKAAISPAMLNSYFYIDGQKMEVDHDGFNFDHFAILDSAKNKLVLDGNVNTTDYKHFNFDLSIDAHNFQALNSTRRDNKLYYGRLFLNAGLNIKGTELQPSIDGTLRITNKTRLTVVLPQEEPGVEEREGIVQFVEMRSPRRDSILNAGYDSIGKSSIRSFDISTNIIIDSTAELTLIVDENNGDHLTVKGSATLTGGIDRSGNTTLLGTYQLIRGSYDLTFSILHKKFEIQNGSTITWTGEPNKANLNINAIYVANTSPIDLVSNQISTVSNTNNYLQKLPFYVYLKMKGELLKPDISFDIVLPDDKAYAVSKDVVTTVQAKLQLLRQDQGEMNKQVFALLLLNRFVGEDPFESSSVGPNAESLVRQSVSKILTQQLNKLASNLIHGVDINFDLQSTDDYTTGQLQNRTDLNISVSKQLLNDRLRVTVGSNFELEGPQNVNANQQTNDLAGNIALDYKLSKDGRYLLRAYRRNDYDDVIEGYVIETGMGFIITMDYNHFREIFERKKKNSN